MIYPGDYIKYKRDDSGKVYESRFTNYIPIDYYQLEDGWVIAEEDIISINDYTNDFDEIQKAKHYNMYPVEVIDLVEHMNFCRGNVIKYVARAEFKGSELKDLKKALYYLQREIKRLEGKEE